jgi:hypothetical protein
LPSPRNENLNLLIRTKFYWSLAGGPVLVVRSLAGGPVLVVRTVAGGPVLVVRTVADYWT